MHEIVFKHHFKTTNLGDRVCCPQDYYDDLATRSTRVDLEDPTPQCKFVIYGGGKIMGALNEQLGATDMAANARIAWGVSTVQKFSLSPRYWLAYRKMTLVGSRDWGDSRFQWCPCVTCLAPEFNRPTREQYEVVAYIHHWKTQKQKVHLPP